MSKKIIFLHENGCNVHAKETTDDKNVINTTSSNVLIYNDIMTVKFIFNV